ncbi:MAG: hypothetical protein PXY39_13190 [archaeon]|nr:hypothetical protein [archaeon]
MVYVLDEGSEFDAPLERIWKYLQAEDEHEHRAIKRISVEMQGENTVVVENEVTMENLPPVRNKIKMTMFPPFGFVQEYIDGPMAGSKAFQYYTPKGNKTGVTVVGNFVGMGMDDDSVKRAVLQLLGLAFNEDNENLKKLLTVTM